MRWPEYENAGLVFVLGLGVILGICLYDWVTRPQPTVTIERNNGGLTERLQAIREMESTEQQVKAFRTLSEEMINGNDSRIESGEN